jgi:endonuclease/exonuclease/phosphatase family metal-dependent hydrolase
MKLRVATYNIHKGVTGIRRAPRIERVRQALYAIDADIVFLQEVQNQNERLRRYQTYPPASQLDFLATTGYEHQAYGRNAAYSHGHHGNAILSRHSIRVTANHDISDHALEKRGMLHAVVRVEGRARTNIHLLCVHFGLIERSRLRQAERLVDFVTYQVPLNAPVIIAGDFNDWQKRVDPLLRARLGVAEVAVAKERPLRMAIESLMPWRAGMTARRPARTFPSFAPVLTLDRIYVRGFDIVETVVPRGLAWARSSDHAPLIADLTLR